MSKHTKRGFTLVELLVVIAILGLLVGLMLPAVQAVREAARGTQCKNNLKQNGLAALLHHETLEAFPPARLMPRPGDTDRCGIGSPTWLVRIMPYLEETGLYQQWDLSTPYARHPESVRTQAVASYFCPSRRSAGTSTLQEDVKREFELPTSGPVAFLSWCPGCIPEPPVSPDDPDSENPNSPPEDFEVISIEYKRGALSDYAGNHGDPSPGYSGQATDFGFGGNGTGIIISSRPHCQAAKVAGWRDQVRAQHVIDGLSKTFLIGESHVTQNLLGVPPVDGPAYDGNHLPSFARIGGPDFPLARSMNDPANTYSFGSWHSGICQFVLGDGSVRSLATDVDDTVLARWANRRDSL